MKKVLLVLGATATLLGGLLVPATGFAAPQPKEGNAVIQASQKWVSDILGDIYYEKSEVPKTYFYVSGDWAGTLKRTMTVSIGNKYRGIYEGYIYKKGAQ
ncbi:hypothetical protein [Paenibacillus sp. OSY-SE]|uniref:hypothetical protein n=1 Tax=Paenibacillus sp. OSY-SE TaxID=1196323 RepID=UPI00037A3989|nr:hypothetical protein [Paenibacillus sp. OSY-SE]